MYLENSKQSKETWIRDGEGVHKNLTLKLCIYICVYIYILMDYNYAKLPSLYIFQKTVGCKLPLLRFCHHELTSLAKT